MVRDILEKNNGIERCLEDVFLCTAQTDDDSHYLNR